MLIIDFIKEEKMMNELETKIFTLHTACKVLAGVCDGAVDRDDKGFNKPDSYSGHLMAYRSEWNLLEAKSMCEMLRKYQHQLENYGVDISGIKPEDFPVEYESETPKFLIDLGEDGNGDKVFHVHFPYSSEMVKLMKTNGGVYGAKFYNDPYCRFWVFKSTDFRVMNLFQDNEGFILTNTASNFVNQLIENPPEEIIPEAEETFPVIEENLPVMKPENRIENDNGIFVFYFPYSAEQVAEIKNITGRKFEPNKYESKVWIVKPTATNYHHIEVYIAQFQPFCDDSIQTILESLKTVTTKNLEESRAEDAEINLNYNVDLFPFQRAGVKYALRSERCLIGDEMGLGKTHQSIATVNELKSFPCLVVCPASLKFNWMKEIKKGCGNDFIVSVWDSKNGYKKADFIIINYDLLEKRKDDLKSIGFKAVIMDESHYLKNGKAKRTKAMKEIVKGVDYRFCLTGTPVLNRPNELISQLDILDRLDDLGGFWNFAKRYCGAYKSRFGWDLSGATNLQELNENLRKTCLIRRKKMDVLKEMPAKLRADVTLEIDNRDEYEKAEGDILSFVGNLAIQDKEFLESIKDLSPEDQKSRKLQRASTAEYKAEQAETLVRINTLKSLTAKGKLQSAISWIENFLESGEKLVVFCEHIEIQKAIQKHFNSAHVFGEDGAETRQSNVERFQNDPKTNLIVCSLQAAGVGITLTASSNVAFIEQGWTPSLMLQAEDRCHRIGQDNQCTIWYLLADNTIDEYITELLHKKMMVCEAAVDGKDSDEGKQSILPELLTLLQSKK